MLASGFTIVVLLGLIATCHANPGKFPPTIRNATLASETNHGNESHYQQWEYYRSMSLTGAVYRTVEKLYGDFKKILETEIEFYNYDSVAIISDSDKSSIDVKKAVADCAVSVIHIDSQTENISFEINKSYVDLKVIFFILIVKNPDGIMDEAEIVFRNKERGRTAAMTHKTKWLIILIFPYHKERVIENLKKSVFDHVCVFTLRNLVNVNRVSLESVRTLMWRTERKREFEHVDMAQLTEPGLLFPNTKYGFNGRNFHTLTKFYFSDSFIKIPHRGAGFSGVYYDIMYTIAKSLNFTFDVEVTNMSWSDYRKEVSLGHTDIGLSFWRVNNNHKYKMSTTYAVFFNTIRAMYQISSPKVNLQHLSFRRIFPLPSMTYYILVVAILISALFSLVLKYHSEQWKAIDHGKPFQASSVSNSKCSGKFLNCVKSYIAHLWQYLGSSLQQPAFPAPLHWSSYIFVWSWSLMLFMLYALYTGHLTSEGVMPKGNPPFQTFGQMMEGGDYRWAAFDGLSLKDIFKRSPIKTFQRLGDGLIDIKTDKWQFKKDKGIKEMLSLLDKKYVYIAADNYLNYIIKNAGRSRNLVIMKEYLFQSVNGYVLPRDSELTKILSNQILVLHESGIKDKIFKTYSLSMDTRKSQESVKIPKHVSNEILLPLSILIGTLISVCLMILLFENLFTRYCIFAVKDL